MIEAFRSLGQNIIFRIFMLILLVGFVIWGMGDVFTKQKSDIVVAEIGNDTKITQDTLKNAVHLQIKNIPQLAGKSLTDEEIASLHINEMVLQKLINEELYYKRSQDVMLKISDDLVATYIKSNPIFQEDGKFSKEKFLTIIRANNLSEEKYIDILKRNIGTSFLVSNLEISYLPQIFYETEYKLLNQEKIVDLYFVKESEGKTSNITKEEIEDYYEKHKDKFKSNEVRHVSLLSFSAKDFSNKIEVNNEILTKEYKDNMTEYQRPELRNLYNIVFQTKEDAEHFYTLLSSLSFEDAVKKIKSQSANNFLLKDIKRGELGAGLEEIVFKLKENEVSKIVETSLGFHITKITKISPEGNIEFDEVKSKIKENYISRKSTEMLFDISKKIDDDLAAGMKIEEVAKKYALPVNDILIEDTGKILKHSKDVPHIELTRTAFTLDKGTESQVYASEDNNIFYVVRVDEITPSEQRPLPVVENEVIEMKSLEKIQGEAKNIANLIKENLENNKSKIVNDGANVVVNYNVAIRNQEKNSLPTALIVDIMEKNIGDTSNIYQVENFNNLGKGVILAHVNKIKLPENFTISNEFTKDIIKSVNNNFLFGYLNYLFSHYKVKIQNVNK